MHYVPIRIITTPVGTAGFLRGPGLPLYTKQQKLLKRLDFRAKSQFPNGLLELLINISRDNQRFLAGSWESLPVRPIKKVTCEIQRTQKKCP